MGLDMYLIRKKYIGAEYEHRHVTGKIEIKIDGKKIPINFDRISYIEEKAAYWRKANHIHKWFVDNVQDGVDDCGYYDVTTSDLKTLLELCIKVRDTAMLKKGKVYCGTIYKNGKEEKLYEDGEYIVNGDEIEKILPTESGFFFGSTDYDYFYMNSIIYTINTIEALLKDEEDMNKKGFYSDFQYHSSW